MESSEDSGMATEVLADDEPTLDYNETASLRPKKDQIDFDAILVNIGGWGKFQQILFHGICLPIIFATALMFTVTVFSAAVPKFRCRIPSCDANISTLAYSDAFTRHFDWFTIPPGTGEAECKVFRYEGNSSSRNDTSYCTPIYFDPHSVEDCTEWVFDTSVFKTTFMAEDNIVCGNSWKGPLSQSIFFFGVLLAALSSGLLADRFGRRHVSMACILLLSLSSLGMAFAHNYVFYVIMSFFIAIAQAGLFLVSFILAMEMVGSEKRVFCGVIIEIYFVVGEVLSSGLTYWQRDWRYVVTICSLPSFVFLLYWPVLPESVRWLLSKHRYGEAQLIANKISHWNDRPVVDIRMFQRESSNRSSSSSSSLTEQNETMIDLLRDRVLAWRLLNLCSTWLVIVLGYYGLSLSSVSLSGDPYLNFFLVSMVEVPGYIFAWWGMEKFGRRMTMVSSLMAAGIALLANAAVCFVGKNKEPEWFWFNLIAFLVGKCGLTSAFGAVYVFSSELFPTSIRTAGVGTCSTCGRIGAVVTPWISDLAKRNPSIMMTVFGGSAVVSGLLNLFLPETLGLPLPENLAQAKEIGRQDRSPIEAVLDGEEEPLL